MQSELGRGAVAGAVGGAAMGLVLLLAGEGPLQRAINREQGGGAELVSRGGQRVGGVIATVLVGTALGLVLAIVAIAIRRRGAVEGTDPWRASLRLAAVGFVLVNLIPFLKYPPNPPGVGDPDTIATRTGAYLALLAWSLLVAWATWRAWRWLQARQVPVPLAAPAVAVAGLMLVALAYAVLPAAPSPDATPASIVSSFRLASLGGWAAYWAVAGTVLGWLRLPAGSLSRARPRGLRTPV